jgi:S-adenosylmethionine decarboxylase proenzyme
MSLHLRHLLVELGACSPALLDDPERVRTALAAAAEAAGTRLLGDALHRFEPHGVTGVALLAESHVAIHTWPELGVAACDLLTCSAHSDLDRVVAELRQAFGAARVNTQVVVRGPA